MAFAKFNDIEFNQHALDTVIFSLNASNSSKNKRKLNKFLVIDFSEVDMIKLNSELKNLSVESVRELIYFILYSETNEMKIPKDAFMGLMKFAEFENEEILWSFLVGDFISNEVYQISNYDENLELAYKVLYKRWKL